MRTLLKHIPRYSSLVRLIPAFFKVSFREDFFTCLTFEEKNPDLFFSLSVSEKVNGILNFIFF